MFCHRLRFRLVAIPQSSCRVAARRATMPAMNVSRITSARRRIVVLGSTGSIGTNCLDVVDHLSGRLEVQGLSAHSNSDALLRQAQRYRPRWVALTDAAAAKQMDASQLPPGCRLLYGPEAVAEMVQDPDVDIVVTAIVGAAGLLGTWAALEAGKTVAVANKETLVLAGALVTDLAARRGGRLLPVDSEHSAIFQAMQGSPPDAVERIGRSHGRGSPQTSDLAHGSENHDRLGHAHE